MTWLYLALAAPLLAAIVNIFDDNLLGKIYQGALAGTTVTGLFGIIPAIVIILLKPNSANVPAQLLVLSLLTGFLIVVAYYSYFKGLEREDPSVVAALFCLTPAAIPFIAFFVVGERLSTNAIIGFSIVIVSAFLYSLSSIRKFTISKALLPAITAAALFDVVAVTNKYVYTKIDFSHAYFYFSIGMFMAGIVFFIISLRHPPTKQNLWDIIQKKSAKLFILLAAVEALALIAELLRNKALSLGSVSLVAALQNLQPLYVLVISLLFYPLYPKYFRSRESGNIGIKLFLAAFLVLGVYIAVQ